MNNKYKQPPNVEKSNTMEELVSKFYENNPFAFNYSNQQELEITFGTKGLKYPTRTDFDNVIGTLKSHQFTQDLTQSNYYLRVNPSQPNNKGYFQKSQVRAEIVGLENIQTMCETNDVAEMEKKGLVQFVEKYPYYRSDITKSFVDYDDFNFRVSYKVEEPANKVKSAEIVRDWSSSRKYCRYLNRFTFVSTAYPVKIDISIVKTSHKTNKSAYVKESGVFDGKETYEFEIEILNDKIGPYTLFNTPRKICQALNKVITIVLSGIQGSKYPVSFKELKDVALSYKQMIMFEDKYNNPLSSVLTKKNHFIGPNSITLQLSNVAPLHNDSENLYNTINIRKDFVVTEKADGVRSLLYIHKDGRIYIINNTMNIIFTGALISDPHFTNTLLDGELISHDKHGKFVNTFAAFDLYYMNTVDVRHYHFIHYQNDDSNGNVETRYNLLSETIHHLQSNAKMFTDGVSISPIQFIAKRFYPSLVEDKRDIMKKGCKVIFEMQEQGLYPYNTDGLIFTHMYFGVGSDQENTASEKKNVTWEYSFKWKPPEFNTIDFLVTESKRDSDVYNDNINQCKTIELRCGFNQKYDGFVNPWQGLIDDELAIQSNDESSSDYMPCRFYPIEPPDMNAGLTKIPLKMDNNGHYQMMTEENEVFTEKMIVEFRYNIANKEGYRWVPFRVRYDKTGDYQRGLNEYGNSYKTACNNWKSINYRINSTMLTDEEMVPEISVSEDVYYNGVGNKNETKTMKTFHNLIKNKLIQCVSNPNSTLIDVACGKGGDLHKWIFSQLAIVVGIDKSRDNIENRLDGACCRYLKEKLNKNVQHIPKAVFLCGDSGMNIRNGSSFSSEKEKEIMNNILGLSDISVGKGVDKLKGVGVNGFNICSCQFALHYFFKNVETLKAFIINVSECTKLNGYFIGTAYDGQKVFKKLANIQKGEHVYIYNNDKKIWSIKKEYEQNVFDDDNSSLGYEINVFQESINQHISEYLIHFGYLVKIMSLFGFEKIDKRELNRIGLPNSIDSFDKLVNIIKTDEPLKKFEREISFLNNYFIFQKVRNVDPYSVYLEETNEMNGMEEPIVGNISKKPNIVKLNRQITVKSVSNETKSEIMKVDTVEKEFVKPIAKPKPKLKLDTIVEVDEKESKEIVKKPRAKPKPKLKLVIVEKPKEPELKPELPLAAPPKTKAVARPRAKKIVIGEEIPNDAKDLQAEEKLPRCPKGQRRNKKTKECEDNKK